MAGLACRLALSKEADAKGNTGVAIALTGLSSLTEDLDEGPFEMAGRQAGAWLVEVVVRALSTGILSRA